MTVADFASLVGQTVEVTTDKRGTLRGVVLNVGNDILELRGDDKKRMCVRLDTISASTTVLV